ncbi:hypothetical protein [Halobacteriovorax sp. DA5]|uniref:hypothetical protein n=1 Tax=Halobacteriovorax sp. DA5 TaxID=2067553 RepID=UPI000CD240B4|nr:hypothetical protein [Halobacteriovorax sp. DA5]POB14588.1 hypothetical protein C0Z22_05700 [Halobacteriovorax sp. DA5]
MGKSLALMLINLNILASFGGLGGFGGLGTDIDHNPTYRRRTQDHRAEVPRCVINRAAQKFHLNKTSYKLDELFSLVSTTAMGQEVVERITALLDSGKLAIKNLSQFERERRGLTHRTSALFDFTMQTPTIFIGLEDELGLVAHFFVHEATHALDELIPQEYEVDMIYYNTFKDFQKLFGLDLEPMKELTEYETAKMYEIYEIKEKNRAQHAYRAERFAFDQQGVFTNQVLEANDCYEEYISQHRERNKLKLYRHTPDDHIFNAYGINKDYL